MGTDYTYTINSDHEGFMYAHRLCDPARESGTVARWIRGRGFWFVSSPKEGVGPETSVWDSFITTRIWDV